jgi:hypothetical protein
MDLIQYSVDKSAGVVAPEFLGQFDRLVQSGFERNLRTIQKFKRGQTKDVAVYSGHALQGPIFGVLLDERVNLVLAPPDAFNQPLAKLPGLGRRPVIFPVEVQDFPGISLADIQLVKNLEGDLPRSPPDTHQYSFTAENAENAKENLNHEFRNPDVAIPGKYKTRIL